MLYADLSATERDQILLDTLFDALRALLIVNGDTVTFNSFRGTLHFDDEISRIAAALELMVTDPPPLAAV